MGTRCGDSTSMSISYIYYINDFLCRLFLCIEFLNFVYILLSIVDPALHQFLATNTGMSLSQIDNLLNKESGMKGMCGDSDMRIVEEKMMAGDKKCSQAIDVMVHRIKKYIGGFYAELGGTGNNL